MDKDVKGVNILRETSTDIENSNINLKVRYGNIGEAIKDSSLEFKYVGTRSDVKSVLNALIKELEKR